MPKCTKRTARRSYGPILGGNNLNTVYAPSVFIDIRPSAIVDSRMEIAIPDAIRTILDG